MSDNNYLAGKFLLAMPGMGDARFARSVIAICAHDEQGAMGIDIGQAHDAMTLRGVLNEVDIEVPDDFTDRDILLGGPVESQRGFILHDGAEGLGPEEDMDVEGRWHLSGSIGLLQAVADGNGPDRALFAFGYAGWGPGQLEEEMTRHGWMAAELDFATLYDLDAADRWTEAYKLVGIDPLMFSGQFGSS